MAKITHIGTALPPYRITQAQACAYMQNALSLSQSDARKLQALYRASKIEQRHSVLPDFEEGAPTLFCPPNWPSTATRMQVYEKQAPVLALQAVENCLPPHFDRQQITHLITVSCTGMYAPGLDIDLIHALGLPFHTHRIAVQFMGCYAAFNALKTAQALCLAHPRAKVLVVSVELCSLHFSGGLDPDTLLANALFADGAAAALVENTADKHGLEIVQMGCTLFPEGASDMAWKIGDFGFEMRLSSYVPKLLEKGLGEAIRQWLQSSGIAPEEVEQYAMHPGGMRILQAIETALHLQPEQLRASYQTLQQCGNMSSATIFFVWEKLLKAALPGRILSMAFGPGLTAEMAVLHYQ
jgi:predicted naringenin-chalcone synthase